MSALVPDECLLHPGTQAKEQPARPSKEGILRLKAVGLKLYATLCYRVGRSYLRIKLSKAKTYRDVSIMLRQRTVDVLGSVILC